MTNPTLPVLLLWGEDAFLLREAAFEAFGDLRPTELGAAEWEGGETADLSTPSLFGERRGLLVTECRHLPDHAVKELKAYLSAPAPDALLVLVVRVGDRGKPAAALTKMIDGVGESRQVAIGRKEFPSWLASRAIKRQVEISPAAAKALVDALGEDPAELDQAIVQLGDAFPSTKITPSLVAQQFRGLGDQKVWDLCDRAFERNLAGAIRSMRALLDAREDPIPILGAISSRLRSLLKIRSLSDRVSPAQIAEVAGLRFEWQARRYREQAQRFSMQELRGIHDRLVDADRELKSGADGSIVLTTVVTQIAS